MRTGKRNSGGFTVAELLVVVAIIAVLVAVSIPAFASSLERSRAATCMANRRSLKSELTYAGMVADDKAADIKSTFDANKDAYVCPSGGVMSYALHNSGSVTVFCSKHYGDVGPSLFDALDAAIAKDNSAWLLGFKSKAGLSIDSTASGGGEHTAKVKKELADAGVELDALAKTWSIVNNSSKQIQVLWSDQDITPVSSRGTEVRVICLDTATNKYRIGYATVTKSDSGTGDYNVISKAAKTSGFTGTGTVYDSYADAYSAFGELDATRTPPAPTAAPGP